MMRFLKNNIFKKLGSYLIELLIVVVGVSIAFQLSVWNDTRKERIVEDQLLINFRSENLLNMDDMDSTVWVLNRNINNGLSLIELLKDNQSNIDSIRFNLGDLYEISWPTFSSTHLENYLSFISANSAIREEVLLLKGSYSAIKELSNKYSELKQQKFMDYLSDAVDITNNLAIVDRDKLFAVEFRNNLMLILSYEQSLVRTLEEIDISQLKSEELISSRLNK